MLMISDGGTEGLTGFPSIPQAFTSEPEVTFRHVLDVWSLADVTGLVGRRSLGVHLCLFLSAICQQDVIVPPCCLCLAD